MTKDMSRYLDLFLAESREHLVAAHALQSRLEQCPVDAGLWREFMRHAHSLKGMAAAMQYPSVVALTHAAEDLAERLASAAEREARGFLPLIDESLVCLGDVLDRIERGEDAASPAAEELARALRRDARPASAQAPPQRIREAGPPPDPEDGPGPLRHWTLDITLRPAGDGSIRHTVCVLGRLGEIVRVVQAAPASLGLDDGSSGGHLRLTVASGRVRERLEQELRSLLDGETFTLQPALERPAPVERVEGGAEWIRVRTDHVDAIVESLLELRQEQVRLRGALHAPQGPARHHLHRSAMRLKELYGSVMEMRLVPFERVAQRLRQAVQDLAHELGKEVRFEISGGELRIDRAVLDALVEPLLHALRNAVDHGLEPPATRAERGKPGRGLLRLGLLRDGGRARIRIADDGRGMEPERLRRRAVACGALSAGEAAALTDEEALWLVTRPGFTTRERADPVSGRGVGLDVVRQRVDSLGGVLDIRSSPGRGTQIEIRVPTSRALVQTLLARCACEIFAIPIDAVVKAVDTRDVGTGGATAMRYVHIDRHLGPGDHAPSPAAPHALVLSGSEPPQALVVDEVIGRQDLVVRPLHAPLAHLRDYSGAALLDDGSIVLVLDPSGLAARRGSIRLG